MTTRPVSTRKLGWVLFVLALFATFGCRGRPRVSRGRVEGDLRALILHLDDYRATCGGYPDTLDRLLPPEQQERAPACAAFRPFVAHRFWTPYARGTYVWEYSPQEALDGQEGQLFRHYELRATCVETEYGGPSYWASEDGVIRSAQSRRAGRADPQTQ